MNKPDWWPECPWLPECWPMTQEEYMKAVPNPHLRTAISGFLMRQGWKIAEKAIWKCLKDGPIYKRLKDILLSEE